MKHSIATSKKKRNQLVRNLPDCGDILRGSLLERIIRHRQGCPKCARGKGHRIAVLAVTYPGRKIRHISLRSEQVPLVRRQLDNFQRLKAGLEQIAALNQQGLRAKATAGKVRRHNRD